MKWAQLIPNGTLQHSLLTFAGTTETDGEIKIFSFFVYVHYCVYLNRVLAV